MEWPSYIAMRPKGGMENTLYSLFIEHVILPCYLNLQKDTVQDKTHCKIKGPLFIKTDMGPGCLGRDLSIFNTAKTSLREVSITYLV